MFATSELPYALYTLASNPELPTSEHETEELAIAFIRRMKQANGMPTETERADMATASQYNYFNVNTLDCEFIREVAIAQAAYTRELLAEWERTQPEPKPVTRSKLVRVNDAYLCLCWAVK